MSRPREPLGAASGPTGAPARPVVMVAHFPPPVHGMSASAEAFARVLEAEAPVRRHSTAGSHLDRSATYHLRRVARVLLALVRMAAWRRDSRALYMTCDAGHGMIYSLVIVAWAALLGYSVYMHHLCYAYVSRRASLMAAIVRAGRRRCTHLVLCPRMRREFLDLYPHARTDLLSIAYTMDPGDGQPRRSVGDAGPLRLGHMSNLTEEKGLARAFETLFAAQAGGVDCRLVLAGPTVTEADARLLEAALARAGDSAVYLGPLFGEERRRFTSEIDVFLFPTLYVNEAYPLVTWEAMRLGIPLLTYRAGCMDDAIVGDGGVVVDRDEEFATRAAEVLTRWNADRDAIGAAGDRAHAIATLAAEQSQAAASRLARAMAEV